MASLPRTSAADWSSRYFFVQLHMHHQLSARRLPARPLELLARLPPCFNYAGLRAIGTQPDHLPLPAIRNAASSIKFAIDAIYTSASQIEGLYLACWIGAPHNFLTSASQAMPLLAGRNISFVEPFKRVPCVLTLRRGFVQAHSLTILRHFSSSRSQQEQQSTHCGLRERGL